jgi:hypothetical protein
MVNFLCAQSFKNHARKTYGGLEVWLRQSWPLHLMEVSGQLDVPAALLPGKESLVPIVLEAGWAPELVWTLWRKEKWLYPTGNWTTAIQPVVRRYTDWAIPALRLNYLTEVPSGTTNCSEDTSLTGLVLDETSRSSQRNGIFVLEIIYAYRPNIIIYQ